MPVISYGYAMSGTVVPAADIEYRQVQIVNFNLLIPLLR